MSKFIHEVTCLNIQKQQGQPLVLKPMQVLAQEATCIFQDIYKSNNNWRNITLKSDYTELMLPF